MTASPAPSFDAWAGAYDRYRPGYPDELFETIQRRLELSPTPRVVDIGAGTGRAALAMAQLGWSVTALEPGERMLAVLRDQAAAAGLRVATRLASAEATGLQPAAFDLVTAAQAFHWFDKPAALSEMARLLHAGGGIALFWNTRDEDASALLGEFTALLQHETSGAGWWRDRERQMEETRHALEVHPAFVEPELIELRHVEEMTPEAFVAMAFTASQVQALTVDAQDRLRDELHRLLASHGLSEATTISVPYRIDLWIARRNGR